MTTQTAELAERALTLAEDERVELVEVLLASLETLGDGAGGALEAVLARRLGELEAGVVAGVPWEDVKSRFTRGA